jgi:hypothetical protein
MMTIRARVGHKVTGKRVGVAVLLFFLIKGVVWLALGAAGYAAWAN